MRRDTRTYSKEALGRSRQLRSEMSISEKIVWEIVRKKRLGLRFKTQVPVGPFFLDFYCPEAGVCLEVDGEQHFERLEKDKARDEFLRSRGIEVIRIPSLDLYEPTSTASLAWRKVITDLCETRARERGSSGSPPPTPSSSA